MTRVFSRWLPCITLAAWSAVLLHIFLSGRVLAFLTPLFRPGVLVAGVVLGLMALIFLLFPADADCCSAAECAHPLSRYSAGRLFTFLILLLPIVASAMFSPDSFSKNAILNRGFADASSLPQRTARVPSPSRDVATELPEGDAVAQPSSSLLEPPLPTKDGLPPPAQTAATQPNPSPIDYLQRTPEGYIVTEVLDLLYAAQDTALRKDFENKKVELIGQLMPDKTSEGQDKRFKAVRMFMTCCAADARPVATLVEADKQPDLPEMTWVKIVGTATFPVENGKRVAVLKAETVERSEPPVETMLY